MDLTVDTILRLDRNKKIMILVGVLALLGGLYAWLLYMPMQEKLERLEKKLATLISKKQEQEAIVQNLPAFRKECEKLELQVEEALTQLPNKKEIHTLLQNISNLGRESGLRMPSFKPGTGAKKDFYAEVPVEIKLTGAFRDMVGFFYKVGRLPRIVNVRSLEIATASKEPGSGELEATCRATTYRFLEEWEREPPPDEAPARGRRRKPIGRRGSG